MKNTDDGDVKPIVSRTSNILQACDDTNTGQCFCFNGICFAGALGRQCGEAVSRCFQIRIPGVHVHAGSLYYSPIVNDVISARLVQ